MEETKSTYTIFGEKGSGKTTLAFKFKGTKLCFTYDNKSQRIKKYMFASDPSIKIINAVERYNRTPDEMTRTAKTAYEFIIKEIDNSDTDWIIHDGLEKLHEICEMYMRGANQLKPFQGIANQSIWKYRRVLLANLHQKSLTAANKGVIYTTFAKVEETEIEEGQVIEKKPTPRYFDAIEEETDTLFKTFLKDTKEGTRFYAKVRTSKVPIYKTGKLIDFTMKGGEKEE